MIWKKFALVPMLAAAAALGACGGDAEEAEVGEVGEGVETEVGEGVGAVGEGVAAPAAFDPGLDADRDGILDPEEGIGDADGDGIRDRDEVYPAVD